MSKRIKFRPDYAALYPGVALPDDVLDFLKKSDMRMEYEDSHRKRERVLRDTDGGIVEILPSREDSLDRLLETDWQFPDCAPSPEEAFLENADIEELRCRVALLNADDRELIDALFFDGMTEREYAAIIGISQKNVNKKKQRILAKLKKYFEV